MTQQRAQRDSHDDDEDLVSPRPAGESDHDDTDSGYGSDDEVDVLDVDVLLSEIDILIQDAPEWATFVQKGGQ
ncbi:hypothetical protein ACFXPA_38160 [Amycolatopsis sp. NPDC059090]|uniref:hypothetical protein n=1 Tax=Amycolatopsis sp. NPDC059090 TaxID=3346723 RepID=UPI0036707DD9